MRPLFIGLSQVIALFYFSCSPNIEKPLNDGEAVSRDKAALEIVFGPGDTASAVTQNLSLPTSGLYGSVIQWSTDNNERITSTGVVSRPKYSIGDITVTLTATLSRDDVSDSKVFVLTVSKRPFSDVHFRITIPANTPPNSTIDMVCSLNSWSTSYAYAVLIGSNEYEIVIEKEDTGTNMEYKYRRGDWLTGETAISGTEVPNRVYVFKESEEMIYDTVAGWKDQF
jgi:hypothetical protein